MTARAGLPRSLSTARGKTTPSRSTSLRWVAPCYCPKASPASGITGSEPRQDGEATATACASTTWNEFKSRCGPGKAAAWRSNRSHLAFSRAIGKHQHHNPEYHQHDAPPQIHIDAQRFLIDRGIRHQSIDHEHHSRDRKQPADRPANVESHQKITLRMAEATRIPIASVTGRLNQGTASSRIRGVSE